MAPHRVLIRNSAETSLLRWEIILPVKLEQQPRCGVQWLGDISGRE